MIELFVCDIDGCLAEPYQPFDLAAMKELADGASQAGASQAGASSAAPAVTLCSGRPYPYVEAVTQALGLTAPVLFESGGGLFDPATARTAWHPDFTDDCAEQMERVRRWMSAELLPGTTMSLDHSKRTQAGLVGPEAREIAEALPRVRRFVQRHTPALRPFATGVSIDVLSPDLTKKQGLHWLAEWTGVARSEMAYIGDSEGDVEALEAVGQPLAPANAGRAVRQAVRRAGGYVSQARLLEGTLEAYRYCTAQNERRLHAQAA